MAILLLIAFVSGILTTLSPCVLPILPVILGSGVEGKKGRIYGTIVGLIASFTFFALLLSTIVASLGISADNLRIGAAVILGFFGLTLVVPVVWQRIQSSIETIFHPPAQLQNVDGGFGGGLVTGAVLGLVWTPCVGPIIATVTTLASIQSFSLSLVLLVLAYSLGIALPLLAIANGSAYVSQKLGWYKFNQDKVRRWFGVIIIVTAIFIGTGLERGFQSWVLDNLPASISNPVENFENRFSIENKLDDLETSSSNSQSVQGISELASGEVVNNVKLQIDSDGAKIPLNELLNGCPFKDCIPAIDDPNFESVSSADSWLEEEDRVFILEHNGATKIYPQRIMNWHEIVNDWYPSENEEDKVAVAVTFCPLCGTATAFERKVDGVITEFGVSGKLHNSDLVMYDRYQGSLWQQVTGEAIIGPAARRDEFLDLLFLVVLPWRDAKVEFAEASVLSRDTGHFRNYDAYPYGTYEDNGEIYFGVANRDERLHPKEWVYGVTVNGQAKAYPEKDIQAGQVVDTFAGNRIQVSNSGGVISFLNLTTGEEVVPLRSFWFAWAAFNPETSIYSAN